MLFQNIMQKMKKIFLFYFFLYCISSSISNFTLKFFVVLCNNVEKSHAKKKKKIIHEIPIYANFSYVCAPKHVGRIDPSRFERVIGSHI